MAAAEPGWLWLVAIGYPRQRQNYRQEYRGNEDNRRRGNQGGGKDDLLNEMIAAYIQRENK